MQKPLSPLEGACYLLRIKSLADSLANTCAACPQLAGAKDSFQCPMTCVLH